MRSISTALLNSFLVIYVYAAVTTDQTANPLVNSMDRHCTYIHIQNSHLSLSQTETPRN